MPNRLTRLTTLLTQLQARKLVTAQQLAEAHGVSVRTIYRDVRTLEEAGVPVINVEGKGYSLVEGYRMPPVMFTEAEAAALITAETLVRANRDASLVEAYRAATTKLRAILPGAAKDRSELLAARLQSRDNPEARRTSVHLMDVQHAITHHHLCHLAYVSESGHRSERVIEPFAVYTSGGNWIVIARCRTKADFRAFRLDRIQQFRELAEHFEPHRMTLEDYLRECRKNYYRTPDIGLSLRGGNFGASPKNEDMTTQQISDFPVVGISVRTSNADPQAAAAAIGGLWQRLLGDNLATQIPNKVDGTIYCVYTDYESDHTGEYLTVLGYRVTSLDAVPEGFTGITVPGGQFAQFTCKGDLQQGVVYQAWRDIWATDLNRAYRADFEVYGVKAMNPQAAEVEIFVGVNA
ncbi:effector binding domain-containing protein [Lewinella sp. 4G2]|uniref:effector binding domain-containing protein n=1 Tax=Lewinella sp. 4G2 TaxID=1803372 RepID=UPI0007DF098C|nr:effector binding domain-containing protein [Lewinella sp. 4G2]OAV44454.1 hypothetical protein A3850_008110 [Lewinella sp. 4G2]